MTSKRISILTNKTDLELVRLACQDNKAALELLLVRYNSITLLIVQRYVDIVADVQDISQEVLIKLYQSLNTFAHGSSFKTWHFRIVMNTISSYFRKPSYRYLASAVNYEDFENVSPKLLSEDNPHELLIARETMITLKFIFNKMPPELVDVVQFFEIEGISYQEIAEKLKCPIGTVRSRIFRARELIEHALTG